MLKVSYTGVTLLCNKYYYLFISKIISSFWCAYLFSWLVLLLIVSSPGPRFACSGSKTAMEHKLTTSNSFIPQRDRTRLPHLPMSSKTIIFDSRFIIIADVSIFLARFRATCTRNNFLECMHNIARMTKNIYLTWSFCHTMKLLT